MKQILLKIQFLLIALAMTSAAVLAQGASAGSLAGTVTDPAAAVVAGASVVVKNDATGQEFAAVTTENGTFNVPALATGTYTVTISAQGFKQAVVTGVKIDVGQPSSINVALEVGAASETITIVGTGAELLNTQTATIGTTITGRQIVDQPQASRDALDLVTLLPGVQTTGRPRTSTVNGLPKGALNITIDGTDVQDNLISSNDGFFTFVRPRIDSIDEVTVSTATPGAESSGDGAVQIKFVTRTGTNDFTGSAYWYHREPTLNANYFFNNQTLPPDPATGRAPRNRILLNQYGFRAGGPILVPKLYNGRDKAFFFVNYEEFRLPEQQLQQRTILSPLAQSGVFQYVTSSGVRSVNLLELAQANGLPSTIDPTVGGLLGSIRASTSAGGVQPLGNAPNFENFSFVGVGGQERYFTTVRLDYNLTSKHHLENIWNYQEFGGKPVDFLNFTDPSFPGFPNSLGQSSQRFTNTTALRSTLTSTLINEIRFGLLGGISLFEGAGGAATQFANQGGFDLNLNALGIDDASAVRAFPQRGLRLFGNTSNRRNTPSFNLSDNLTWVRGSHTLNFGGSYNLIKSFKQDLNQLVPTVNFGIAEGDPAENVFIADNFPGASDTDLAIAAQLYATLVGRVSAIDRIAFLNDGQYGLLGEQISRFRQPQYSFFVQDSWRARPNLTLNMGLRWEPQHAVTSENDNFARVSYAGLFGESGEGNLFRPGVLEGSPTEFTQLRVGEKLFKTDYNNLAPSFGFAWSPDWKSGLLHRVFGDSGQSVLRGGYSVAFVREGLANVISTTEANPGGLITVNRDTADGTLPIGTLFRNRDELAPPSFSATPNYPFRGELLDAAFGFDPKLDTGLVHSFTLGFQREIFKNTVVEARYVGTRSRGMWRRFSLNEINVVENGFLDEFRQAQANLAANMAAGRGNTFAYFGPGSGTAPLPNILAFVSGIPTAQAGDASLYTSSQFTNAARLAALSPNNANPIGLANTLNTTFLPNAVAAGLPQNFFVVNPGKLGGASLTANDTNTWYDALQLEFRRRFSNGLLVQANYTFSKSLTNFFASSQTSFSQPLTLRAENEQLERFRAPQDLRHSFKVNFIAELPFGSGKRFLEGSNGLVDRLVGGWAVHGTGRIQSGRPFQFGNVQLVGMTAKELQESINIRKHADGTVTYLPDDIILNTRRAFNVSATSATGFGALGVPSGRYIAPANSNGCIQAFPGQCGFSNLVLEGPRFVRFDLSLVKKVRIRENTNLELRSEFLNAFNNINFLIGGTAAADVAAIGNFGQGTFGRVTSAYQDISTTNDPGGRLVNFVLRLNF
ncbi:MAG TPA: carboxypeptidase-like regulatory domain-containing protein [Pyrinomonadaceae bacterium]|jgi:hypothetical protein